MCRRMGGIFSQASRQRTLAYKMKSRPRFSIKALLVVVTFLAVGLGGWIAYSNYKIQNLTGLREQSAIVIVRDQTPKALKSLGIKQLRPLSSVATVELYVTPKGANASIGDSEATMSVAAAQNIILEQATTARENGANDIQLILIDGSDAEWMRFARENSMSVIGESKPRYMARLKANRESGANINPDRHGDARESKDQNRSPEVAEP
jgi:hypothetical protein